ncbi:Predicted flavoprotein CzcO associated with the cation diffusion facilitator CzcD [Saccharopolyspora shandongensis]|uniref:Predicted flavoprotein CzcO associated with the cation diffusion facilitator CzcD n=1 Tax=Saccharopolyspora shandongensis TaxID=418495 RepID=A0A1H3SFR8_9PSEU|nr:NAD(P)/FAD-dependent oxidoreductase [Saccharopolyspora shandongensis]SDZ36500.1 Predicted flavoprotein CzcO associated with the cation diffusion facilitator CzcD [Saccharopolyspora shandongensis]
MSAFAPALASSGSPDVDADELRAHLRRADSAVLLAVLAQVTGDASVLDEFGGAITHVPDPPEMAGRTDPDTAAAIVDRLVAALTADREPGDASGPAPDDLAFFTRLVPVAMGATPGPEYYPMLLEQGGFHTALPVVPRTEPLPEAIDLAIIGGGLAGIAAALTARREGVPYRIYERNDDIGGTWLTQTYPGVGVDTPSSYYSLSAEINPDWSSYYPRGGEYQEYLREVVGRHGIREHVAFGTEVEALTWDDDAARWRIRVRDADGTRVEDAAVVLTAAGYLNRPQFPKAPGRDRFRGLSVHSGEWHPGLDLTGKRVAVIGAGCTAAQIVDAIADDVAHLTLFQRQPHWVAPRKRDSDDVPEHHRWLGRHVPFYANWLRLKAFWGSADNGYPVVIVDPEWAATHRSISRANDILLQDCLAYIDRTFGAGSELAAKVTPDFAPFGKRIIRDPGGYYDALTRDHVDVVAAEPAEITEHGIRTPGGDLVEVDVIVYATGFHLDFLSGLDIRGRDGVRLVDEWAGNDPRSYRGGTVPGFPNLFVANAPNANPSHGAGNNFGIEVTVHYLFECLHLLAERGARSLEPTRAAYEEYVARIDADMERTVWRHTPTAHTYYRNAQGRVILACPWRLVDVWTEHRRPDAAHFTLR